MHLPPESMTISTPSPPVSSKTTGSRSDAPSYTGITLALHTKTARWYHESVWFIMHLQTEINASHSPSLTCTKSHCSGCNCDVTHMTAPTFNQDFFYILHSVFIFKKRKWPGLVLRLQVKSYYIDDTWHTAGCLNTEIILVSDRWGIQEEKNFLLIL